MIIKKIEILYSHFNTSKQINQQSTTMFSQQEQMNMQRTVNMNGSVVTDIHINFDVSAQRSIMDERNEEMEEGEIREESKQRDLNLSIAKPIFALPCGTELGDCPICLDSIDMVNMTVTTCGHVFHSSCIFNSLETTENCPLCRNQLIYFPYSKDDENDDESDDESDNESDEEIEQKDCNISLEQFTKKLINMGYTMQDVLSLIFQDIKSEKDLERYKGEFYLKLDDIMSNVLLGIIKLSDRDTRSYAQVVSQNIISE